MRILNLISAPAAGGAENFVRDLAAALVRDGHEVHLGFLSRATDIGRSPEYERNFLQSVEDSGIKWFVVGNECRRRPWLGMMRIKRYCDRHRISHYHAHLVTGIIFGAPLRIPRLFTEHSARVRGPVLLRLLLKRFVDVHIAISEECGRILRRTLNVAPIVIRNGVCMRRFQEVAPIMAPNDPVKILAVGRICPPKNYPMLIEAISYLSDDVKNKIDLSIIGDGDEKLTQDLANQISEYNLDNTVKLLGAQSDVPSLMAGSDLLVMSSAWEGLPITLIEATIMGLPFVCTDVGACNELAELTQGGGVIVPANDPRALSAAIAELVREPRRRQAMSTAARENSKMFNIELAAKAHAQAYEDSIRAARQ